MTEPTQDKETLREAVAMIVGKHIYGETRSRTYLHVTRPCADEILATMFERLRTPSEHWKDQAIVEVTQADRNFAAPWIAQSVQSFSERSAYRKEIEAGEHDAHPMVIAAATHRIEAAKAERDRIVAWLREMGSIRGGVADAIEAGEHLEESQP